MKKVRRRGRRRQKKRQPAGMHRRSMLAVSLVILLLVVVLSANAVTLKAKDKACQAQEQERSQDNADETSHIIPRFLFIMISEIFDIL